MYSKVLKQLLQSDKTELVMIKIVTPFSWNISHKSRTILKQIVTTLLATDLINGLTIRLALMPT